MNRPTQIADPFAVNDADLQDATFLAGGQIIRHQLLDFARLECVQIQHAINGQLNWFIHSKLKYVKTMIPPLVMAGIQRRFIFFVHRDWAVGSHNLCQAFTHHASRFTPIRVHLSPSVVELLITAY